MKKIQKIIVMGSILASLVSLVGVDTAQASQNIAPEIVKVYGKFTTKVENKIRGEEKRLEFYETLNEKLSKILERRKLSEAKKTLVRELITLTNEEVFELEDELILNTTPQKHLEASEVRKLKNTLSEKGNNTQILELVKNNSKLRYFATNERLEFVEGNTIKRIKFTKYNEITASLINYFSDKKGVIIQKETGKYWYVSDYDFEEKIPYSLLGNYTQDFVTHKKRYTKNGNTFYSYIFSDFIYFEDNYGIYASDLKSKGFSLDEVLLYKRENQKYTFVPNYTKVKLLSSDIIYGVSDKINFLIHAADDKKSLTGETDQLFISLKAEILNITKDAKTKNEKIEIIYNWLLDNVEYTNPFDLADKKIFSGIDTYKNKNGVCEGYVKLASYALMFAGITDVSVIRGDVINAPDFPKIGHAWLKIGNSFYDPTFDDPIGAPETKKLGQYKYFGLPKDLLYANRFDYGVTPKSLETRSAEFRTQMVNANLAKLGEKYRNQNYKVLEGVIFVQKLGLEVGEVVSIETLSNYLPYYEVKDFIFTDDSGVKQSIKTLNFYVLNNINTSRLLEQLDYNLENMYLFKWHLRSGGFEYRLGYDVELG